MIEPALNGPPNERLSIEDMQRVKIPARRVVRAWVAALTTTVFLTLAAAVGTVWLAVDGGNMRPYALLWAIISVAAAYNVTRFWPRRQASAEVGVRLSPQHARSFGDWIALHVDGWRPDVRLVPFPTLFVDQRTLVLGLPLLLGLRENEIVTLLRDAHEVAQPNTWPPVAHALALEGGGLGRGLEGRTRWNTWMSRRMLKLIGSRIDVMHRAHAELARELRSHRDQSWHDAVSYVAVVGEAWNLVVEKWLAPALRQRVWHAEPFTGLRSFTTACEHEGLLIDIPARPQGPDALTALPYLLTYERELAELLVSGEPHDDDPTPWVDHPRAVLEPEWRAMLADGLEAARQATGKPQESSIDAILHLIAEGWGDSIAAVLAPTGANGSDPASTTVLGSLIEAATAVALLDSGCGALHWEWPYGSVMRSQDGRLLSVPDAIADQGQLRSWLTTLGVDPATPLWLNSGRPPAREEPLYAFLGHRRLQTYHVVVSTQFVRLFKRDVATATRETIRMRMSGAKAVLGARMDAVSTSDFADQEDSVALSEVVRATFSPQVGGHWWILRIRTPDRTFAVRGNGNGRQIETWLAPLLGERMRTRWLHSPPVVKWLRDKFGYLCLGIGGTGVAFAAIFAVVPPEGADRLFALAMAGASVCLIAIGLLPDLLNALVQRARGELPHRRPSP